jgi:hypothetical protein
MPREGDEMNHPIKINTGHNPVMGCWDLALLVGNFPTREAAQQYAKILKELLETKATGKIQRPQ